MARATPRPSSSEVPAWPCLRDLGPQSCQLSVAVVPNAKRTEVVGLHDGALRVRLAAPPVDGKANQALVAWLAEALDVPKRHITLARGPASRHKQLQVALAAEVVRAWLSRCLAAAVDGPGGV